MPQEVKVVRYDPAAWSTVGRVWADLASLSPYTTFFVTPEWVESWLEVFARDLEVEILVFEGDARPVGTCLLVHRVCRYGPFPSRCVFINTAGEDSGDSPCIEFNNLLCLPGWERAVAAALAQYVGQRPWDEIWVNGFCQGPPLDALCAAWQAVPKNRTVQANFYVDLKRLRETGVSYESILGPKDRARLRQNFRMYGETTVRIAGTIPDALTALAELADLHQKAWEQRSQSGAFSSVRFRTFHEALIRRTFGSGSIQLSRVDAATGCVGILYNFVHQGRVYFYQSGFVYNANKRVRPGFVALARTIHRCLESPDLQEFHFMPGGDHYKEPMATDRQELEWLVFQRRNLKNSVIRLLREGKRRLLPRRAAASEVKP